MFLIVQIHHDKNSCYKSFKSLQETFVKFVLKCCHVCLVSTFPAFSFSVPFSISSNINLCPLTFYLWSNFPWQGIILIIPSQEEFGKWHLCWGRENGASTKRPLLRTLLPYITVLVCVIPCIIFSWTKYSCWGNGSGFHSVYNLPKHNAPVFFFPDV